MLTKTKFENIYGPSDLARLTFNLESETEVNITADLHGLTCKQAKTFVNNTINLIGKKRMLKIIHGYNHGTAIKEMLWEKFTNRHIEGKIPDPYNLGVTYIKIS